MRDLFSKKRYLLFVLLAVIGINQTLGNSSTYYSKLTGAADPSGKGTVYIDSKEGANTKNSEATSAPTHSYTIQAQPSSDDYVFDSWTAGTGVTIDNPTSATTNARFTANSLDSDKPTPGTVTANFVRQYTYYAKVNAIVSPSGAGSIAGEMTKSVKSKNSSSSEVTFTLTASHSADYSFIGWSTSQNENDIIVTEATRSFTVKATSTDEANPTTVTYYALFARQVATPTIIIDTSTGSATITCTTEGATIYYTTDGSNPTPSLTPYGGAFTVTEGTVVKAIAVKDGYKNSAIATQSYTTSGPTGISGGVVTLNDLEDHNWSYYSDEECPIHSLNPADVKITYYGNGTKTVTTTNDDNPTSFTADATGVKVGIDADANTFVYYKTLERTDGSTATSSTAATGRCAYKTIPNPFSVRPIYGTGDTRWRGFYKWRVKKVSGGTIYSASTGGTTYEKNSTIDAEEEIYFAPSSEYGMEVEFEALWARAYVVTTNTTSGLKSSVSYERNFVYLSSNTTLQKAALNYPVTYTTLDPSTGNGTKCTITIRDNFTCSANTKFENLTFAQYNNNAQTLTANGYNLIVGRGCSGTINYVRGINANITSPNYTIRLESGTYNYFSALRGYAAKGSSTGSDTGSNIGGTPSVKVIFGCDYDRATDLGITDNLTITNGVFYGYSVSEATGITYSETAFRAIVKSGKIGKGFTIDNSYEAKADGTFYIGNAGNRLRGCRNLLIEGGQIASIAGGIDNSANKDLNSVKIRMKGGHVRGVVYGGGARSAAYGNRSLIFTGGIVTGWIGGGCNGEPMSSGQNDEDTYGGITHGASFVYFGGNAICGGEGSDVSINGSIGGIVFGAGKGVEDNTTSGRMAKGTTVVIADNCNVQRNVYGGGNFGYALTSTNIFVGGGTVQGGVFGGSNKNNGPVVSILMKDGTIKGGLYGGSNDTGTISDDVTMNINGGQVGTSSASANIHGGGYGNETKVNGNVTLTLGANTTAPGVTVYGDVYGGSALGTVNDANSDETKVTLNCGIINGSLYGGGLGNATYAAAVNGKVTVTANGGRVTGAVYGCNNVNGAPANTVTVNINNTASPLAGQQYALNAVYGGGNKAAYNYSTGPVVNVHDGYVGDIFGGGNEATVAKTDVNIFGGHLLGNVYGGGNKADITTGGTDVDVTGGRIYNVFGGNNESGNITGEVHVDISDVTTLTAYGRTDIDYVYGGGNLAPYTVSTASKNFPAVNMNAGLVRYALYGGGYGERAIVTGNPQVKMTGGTVGYTETVDGKTVVRGGDVFGGGNAAEVIGNTSVVITGGEVKHNVYGGGNQAKVTGKTNVVIGE